MNVKLSILALSLMSMLLVGCGMAGYDVHTESMGPMHGGNALGSPGDSSKVSRTIEIGMQDTMRFTPDRIEVHAGETVRFSLTNSGKLPHEFVIDSMAELKEHAGTMRTAPTMMHAANQIGLDPGQSGELVWRFGTSGTADFACLVPGHMEAGMVGQVHVE